MVATLPLLRVDGVAHAAWCALCHNDLFLTEHGIGQVFAFCLPTAGSRFRACDGPPVRADVRCLRCGTAHSPLADLA